MYIRGCPSSNRFFHSFWFEWIPFWVHSIVWKKCHFFRLLAVGLHWSHYQFPSGTTFTFPQNCLIHLLHRPSQLIHVIGVISVEFSIWQSSPKSHCSGVKVLEVYAKILGLLPPMTVCRCYQWTVLNVLCLQLGNAPLALLEWTYLKQSLICTVCWLELAFRYVQC